MKRKKEHSTSPTLFPTRVCKVCGKEKILDSEFFPAASRTAFLHTCRVCYNKINRKKLKKKRSKPVPEENKIPLANDGTRFRVCTMCKEKLLETTDNFGWRPREKAYRSRCKRCEVKDNQRRVKSSPLKYKKRSQKYTEENRDIINERKRQRRKEGKTNDSLYWNSPAKFKTYAHKLTIEEDPKEDENGYLLAKCAYCGQYFYPTNRILLHRAESLNNIGCGERRLYCSQGCKKACPIYGRQDFPKGFKKASSREVDPLIRQLCLKRDDYTCQRCGALITEAELHAHHIEGAVQQPMLANDVENTITLCKKCHKWVHSQDGCHYFDLRCKK